MTLPLVAILAAGCGGGSGSTASSAPGQAGRSSAPQAQTQTTGASSSSSPVPGQQGSTATSTAKPVASGQAAVAAANAICTRRNRELLPLAYTSKSLHAVAAAARKRAAVEQRALGELERLTPPPAIAGPYRKILDGNQATLIAIVKVGEAAEAGNAAAVRSAKAGEKPGRLGLLLTAVRAGLKSCGGLPVGHAPAGLPVP